MKRIECIGIVGKFPTPKGLVTFYDTGISVSAVEVAEAMALQHAVFNATGEAQKIAIEKVKQFTIEIAQKVNVYPKGYAAFADDGRILVTEPWFESKE
ncbi:MAG TPA: hypothetical protein VMW64_07530 [Dehalococcoidia bacterium]|nr:hypothetical protein [Dehalococcoidia bacterium]